MEWENETRVNEPKSPGPAPMPLLDHEGQYRDALLRSPHKAEALERLVIDQQRVAETIAEAIDAEWRATLMDELRTLQRDEARMLAEIWYEELGGEG